MLQSNEAANLFLRKQPQIAKKHQYTNNNHKPQDNLNLDSMLQTHQLNTNNQHLTELISYWKNFNITNLNVILFHFIFYLLIVKSTL